jgi:small subunit ribosomal protein S18
VPAAYGGRPRPQGGRGLRGQGRRKHCQFCVSPREHVIDYKNIDLLRRFMDDRMRIRKARQTGTCRQHQARLAGAIKRSREMALVPYVAD